MAETVIEPDWNIEGSIHELKPGGLASRIPPLPLACNVVQFSRPLSDGQYKSLAARLSERPDVRLRAYADYQNEFRDLEFLRFFPDVKDVQIDLPHIGNIDGLRYLPETLESLGLGATIAKVVSAKPIARFKKLKSLHLEGHVKDIAAIGELQTLEHLSLRSVTLPDLTPLLPLQHLRKFELRLGGTHNLELLSRLPRLQYLELWMVKGLSELNVLAGLEALEFLFLQSLKNVETLPGLAPLKQLRRVHLQGMRGLTDLEPVAQAPNLEELMLVDMGQLSARSLSPFVNHARLRALVGGLNGSRKNETVRSMFSHLGDPASFIFGD